MILFVEYLLIAVQVVPALLVAYLLVLTVAAALAAPPPAARRPTHRFGFLIPAHNEARLLPSLLENLRALDYPRELFTVFVVADNCDDETAELARQGGATTFERTDRVRVGKGFALNWLLEQVLASDSALDALAVLDADTVVSPNFLRAMDARLACGERIVQAYYAVRAADESWGTSLRAVAMAAWNYLRPLGRMRLGASAGLKGNGMVMAADVARQHPWPASLTEDLEHHTTLILAGERVAFAPEARVWAEMPTTLAGARSQQLRWEQGRLEIARRYVPLLMHEAVRRRSIVLLDAMIEQVIPPFSMFAAVTVALLALALAIGSPAAIAIGAATLAGELVYIVAGMALARVPRRVALSLLYAPAFILWKLWIYAQALTGRSTRWVRTTRNGA